MLPNLKCIGNQDIFYFCATQDCKLSSVVCNSTTCEECKKHFQCHSMYLAPKLIKKITDRGEERKKIDQAVLEMYDSMIKTLAKQKKDFLTDSKSFFGLSLQRQEKKLFQHIVNEQVKLITPYLVRAAEKQLNSYGVADKINKIKSQIPKLLQSISKVCDDARSIWDAQISTERILFNRQLCIPQCFSVSESNKTIKRTEHDPNTIKFIIMDQTIQKFKKMKYQFKILNVPLFFGMAHIQTMKQIQFQPTKVSSQDGTYLMGIGGKTYNCSYGEEVQNTSFRASSGDIVGIQIDEESQKMFFYKKKIEDDFLKKQTEKIEMNFVIKQGNPLHLCIAMSKQGAAVEYLGAQTFL